MKYYFLGELNISSLLYDPFLGTIRTYLRITDKLKLTNAAFETPCVLLSFIMWQSSQRFVNGL
jgi:hypothetical protein